MRTSDARIAKLRGDRSQHAERVHRTSGSARGLTVNDHPLGVLPLSPRRVSSRIHRTRADSAQELATDERRGSRLAAYGPEIKRFPRRAVVNRAERSLIESRKRSRKGRDARDKDIRGWLLEVLNGERSSSNYSRGDGNIISPRRELLRVQSLGAPSPRRKSARRYRVASGGGRDNKSYSPSVALSSCLETPLRHLNDTIPLPYPPCRWLAATMALVVGALAQVDTSFRLGGVPSTKPGRLFPVFDQRSRRGGRL